MNDFLRNDEVNLKLAMARAQQQAAQHQAQHQAAMANLVLLRVNVAAQLATALIGQQPPTDECEFLDLADRAVRLADCLLRRAGIRVQFQESD